MNSLNINQLEGLCEVAISVAKQAGQYIQSQFDQHYKTERKEGGDSLASQVVTAVDLKAQEIILQGLQSSIETFDLGLLTEESTDDKSRAEKAYFWCIDPMDGTLPFTEHRTGYSVSIALISQVGDPVVAVVYIPDLNQCFSAIRGAGVMLDGKPFERKKVDAGMHFYMDKSFQSEPYHTGVMAQFREHYPQVSVHSSYGGVRNAIGVMQSESGVYFKYPKAARGCGSIWDYAATRLFFEELGLLVSNAAGERLHLNNLNNTFMNEGGVLYATNEQLRNFVQSIREHVYD